MDTRELGQHGPSLSVLGLGCNNFGMRIDAPASAAVVGAALDAGITHFDTAESYGGGRSEEFLGAALGARRDGVTIATKFAPRAPGAAYTPGALGARIREACDGSLRRLGTDHIDLYYQHYPDRDAPIDEALETLDALVREGKVRHIASSNVGGEEITAAASTAANRGWTAFAGVQAEWSLLSRAVEDDVVPASQAVAMGVVPYFPLASGLLTGKYRAGTAFPDGSRLAAMEYFAGVATDENFAKVERLTEFAEARGRSLVELALGWLLAQPAVTSVIAGATSPEQVAANVAASGWRLEPADLQAIDEAPAGA